MKRFGGDLRLDLENEKLAASCSSLYYIMKLSFCYTSIIKGAGQPIDYMFGKLLVFPVLQVVL
jgi:hypothetical protein